jgi:hypothetical protein
MPPGLPPESLTGRQRGAIALRTTRDVPRDRQPEVRLVQLGAQNDLLGMHFDALSEEQRTAVLSAHPRMGFKTGIIEAFAAGIRDKPETAFGTVNTDFLEATVPGYVRPNVCDYIRAAPFAS